MMNKQYVGPNWYMIILESYANFKFPSYDRKFIKVENYNKMVNIVNEFIKDYDRCGWESDFSAWGKNSDGNWITIKIEYTYPD